jgi:hypothetical protein
VGTCHRRWQSDPERGSETMSATVREARMIEQPMIPLHPTLCQQPAAHAVSDRMGVFALRKIVRMISLDKPCSSAL